MLVLIWDAHRTIYRNDAIYILNENFDEVRTEDNQVRSILDYCMLEEMLEHARDVFRKEVV